MKKKMNLLVKRMAINQVAVCTVSTKNLDVIESPKFNAKLDFSNVVEVALHSYDTWNKAMWSMTFYCENRYVAAYIIRLMRKEVKSSACCIMQDTELSHLLGNKEIYDRVVNWKASNGLYVFTDFDGEYFKNAKFFEMNYLAEIH